MHRRCAKRHSFAVHATGLGHNPLTSEIADLYAAEAPFCADAWRELGVSWREPMVGFDLTPHEKTKLMIAELIRPKSFDEVIAAFDQEQAEDGSLTFQ